MSEPENVPLDEINEISTDNIEQLEADNGGISYILYITLGIIFIVLIIWVIKTMIFREDPINVLNEMTNITGQINPVTDL